MERLQIVLNDKLDMSFLQNILETKEEMALVNPTANFPFEKEYWLNFYKLENRQSCSLHFVDKGRVIGHAALQQNFEHNGIVHLCFFLLCKSVRRKGYSQKFLEEIENYILETFEVKEYYLNVLKENVAAIKCYRKSGFEDYRIEDVRIKMVKVIKN